MKRHAKKSAPSNSRLRIIAGTWRGRKLPILEAEGLRPTGDRLRETLFNWLAPHLPGSRCLDLFAGTGALGFEALSRSAASATMLELHREVADQLRANQVALGAKNADIIEANALDWLNRQTGQVFDLVFVDPPFADDLWQKAIDALERQGSLAPHAYIYVETPKHFHLTPPENWKPYRHKVAGAVCMQLFVRDAPEETSSDKAR